MRRSRDTDPDHPFPRLNGHVGLDYLNDPQPFRGLIQTAFRGHSESAKEAMNSTHESLVLSMSHL